jgi:type I restriction enzyme S subunit
VFDWEQRRLGEIATMNARIGWQNLRTSEFLDNGDYMLITGTDFKDGAIDYSNIHYVEKERFEQDKKIQISNGSILITKDGTLGKVAYVEGLTMPATLNAGVFNVRVKENLVVDRKYLFHYLKAPFLLKFADQRSTGGTIKHLNQNVLVEFPIPLPRLEEQYKIAGLLSSLDTTITLHQDKLNHLKRLKHAFLQQMFPKIEEKIPSMRFAHFREEWEKFTLKDVIVSEIKGKAKSEMVGTETPYLETNYLNGGEISYVDSPLNVENDDVIILWDGSQAGTVYSGFSGALGSTLKALKSKESGAFLFQYLKRYQELIYKSYRTPNIPHVVKTFTTDFSIISPSLEEQKKVSSILNNLDNLIILHQKKIETIRNLKKSYLQKMFI